MNADITMPAVEFMELVDLVVCNLRTRIVASYNLCSNTRLRYWLAHVFCSASMRISFNQSKRDRNLKFIITGGL